MKKIVTIITGLMILVSLTACFGSKGSMTSTKRDNEYVVTFKNASKDMNVSTEMTLGENQSFTFDHQLEDDDLVKVEFKQGNETVSELQLSGNGGGQAYDPAGDYTVVVTVAEKANGSVTISIIDLENTSADMENPWKVTTDLQEAIDATGVDFNSPIAAALPADMPFTVAMYTDDVLQVNYGSEETNELIFRVSKVHDGKIDLGGDYNDYAEVWNHSFKGLNVNLYGDDENNIHLATFSAGGLNYAVSYNAFNDGPGLTPDQLNSIFNGM